MAKNKTDKGQKPGDKDKHRVTNDNGKERSNSGEIRHKPGFPGVVDTVSPPSKKPGRGSGGGDGN